MLGDRAARVLGLMFSLLGLLSLTNGAWQCTGSAEACHAVEKAEAARDVIQSVRTTSQELIAEFARHTETMQEIIGRGPTQMLLKLQPMYKIMETMIDKAKQDLQGLKKEHELMEQSLAQAHNRFGYVINDTYANAGKEKWLDSHSF